MGPESGRVKEADLVLANLVTVRNGGVGVGVKATGDLLLAFGGLVLLAW